MKILQVYVDWAQEGERIMIDGPFGKGILLCLVVLLLGWHEATWADTGRILSLESESFRVKITNYLGDYGYEAGFDVDVLLKKTERSKVLSSGAILNHVYDALMKEDKLVFTSLASHYANSICIVQLEENVDSVELPQYPLLCRQASFSPDKRWAAFETFFPRHYDKEYRIPSLWLLELSGTFDKKHRIYPKKEEEKDADGRVHSPITNLLWSRDSGKVVYFEYLWFIGDHSSKDISLNRTRFLWTRI